MNNRNNFFLVKCEFLAPTYMAVKFYYAEVLDEKLKPPSRLQAFMDKAMDHVQKDHTSTFTKHLSICNLIFGPEF